MICVCRVEERDSHLEEDGSSHEVISLEEQGVRDMLLRKAQEVQLQLREQLNHKYFTLYTHTHTSIYTYTHTHISTHSHILTNL